MWNLNKTKGFSDRCCFYEPNSSLNSNLSVTILRVFSSHSVQAKDDPNTLASVQKKWDDICQRIHQTPAFPKLSFQPVRPQFPLQLVSTLQAENPPHQPSLSVKISKPKHTEDQTTRTTTNSPLSCVTTDLGLGTIYQESSTPVSLNRRDFELIKEKPLSRYCKDFKSLGELLSRKVGFQNEAVNVISEIICGYRDDRSHLASATSNVWLALLGPDQVGKKKVATTLAEAFFGGRENCVCVDFKAQDRLDDRFRGKTVVDYIAGEVSKRVESVVFIENVDKAEFPDQVRLSDAVRTGKLRDSHGREIGMKNVIVLATTSNILDERVEYSEGRVLTPKNCKLQIKLADNANKNGKKMDIPELPPLPELSANYCNPLPNNPSPPILAYKGRKGRIQFNEAILSQTRVINFVQKDIGEMFPKWEFDVEDPPAENIIKHAMREGFGTCLKEIKYLSERVEAVEKKVGVTTKQKGTSSQNTTSPPKLTLEPRLFFCEPWVNYATRPWLDNVVD
ncbi:hypothetical protein F2Q70_00025471 [Brassica cretica]|uniref:ATPase AAA-type core domain-containing protein n=1 Tax=Brassica cretica TaxID=69181 RepID=A0A8S9L9S5_BRACR|nr:hypothetical protein F2Q70_00025471 [Brassica cretica]